MALVDPRVPMIPDAAVPDLDIDGRRIYFVWNPPQITRKPDREGGMVTARVDMPVIPKGIIIVHGPPHAECVAWLAWTVDPDAPTAPGIPPAPHWDLISLHPLSIREGFVCSACGELGGIREGQWWISADGGRPTHG